MRRISAALATIERYARELGAALIALECIVGRQIERLREQDWEQWHSQSVEKL